MTDCGCPKLKPKNWELKKHFWKEKAFYVTKHRLFLHIPIGIGKAITKGMDAIKEKGYKCDKNYMMLEKETGFFSAKMMIALEKVPKGDPNVEVLRKTTLYSKYFKGEFKELKKPIMELIEYVKKKEKKEPKEVYCWYTNCPKCWEKEGKITVIFAQV